MKHLKTNRPSVLLIAIGNIGRADDGLGWRFADEVSKCLGDEVTVEYRYQLQVEDSEPVSKYDIVVFVDASHQVFDEGFQIKTVTPAGHYHFSSHAQAPETILYLSETVFSKTPRAYTIAISGYKWGLKLGLSSPAKSNLLKALQGFYGWLNVLFLQANTRFISGASDHSELPFGTP